MHRSLAWIFSLLVMIAPGWVWAADIYTVDVIVTASDNNTYQLRVTSSNTEEIINTLRDDNLQRLFEERYPETSFDPNNDRIRGLIDFRGVPIELSFLNEADPSTGTVDRSDMFFQIQELNGQGQFFRDGFSRSDNLEAFKDFLGANDGDIVSQLYRLLAQRSASDPIAGNPASVQANSGRRDFEKGFTHKVSQIWGCAVSARSERIMLARAGFACQQELAAADWQPPAIEVADAGLASSDMPSDSLYLDYFDRMKRLRGENKLSLGLQYAQIDATRQFRDYQRDANGDLVLDAGGNPSVEIRTRDESSTMVSLPLSYTVVFDKDPNRKLVFSLPISMTDSEGATTYQLGLGVGYNYPVNGRWTLTPSAGMSVVGSEDLGAASALASFSVTSSYSLQLGDWALNIGNMLGSYSTQKLKVGEYESDPGISNTIMTNGLLVSGPSSLLANDLVLEYFINDTRYSGDDLFTDNAQEVGINFGKINTMGEIVTSYLKGGISYLKASGEGDNAVDVLRLSLVFKF